MSKNKALVRYHNDMNIFSMGKFNKVELSLFIGICFLFKKENTNEIIVDFSELKDFSNYEQLGVKKFHKDMTSMFQKLASIILPTGEDPRNSMYESLFSKFGFFEERDQIYIKLREEFEYLLLSDFSLGNFTEYELVIFHSLKSNYSKLVYPLLQQYKNKKKWEHEDYKRKYEVTIDEFRRILDIPKTYKMNDINKRVLAPITTELSEHFLNLELNKIRNSKREISILVFTWEVEKKELLPADKERKNNETGTGTENKSKSKIVVEHREQMNMFQEKKIIKKAGKELTSEEITKKKEELMKLFKKKEENSEQEIEIKEEETSIFIEKVEKNSEQNNLDVVPGGDVPEEKNTYIITEEEKAAFDEFKKFRETLKSATPKEVISVMLDNRLNFEEIGLVSYLCFSDIPVDELLSKKGLPLVGGALKMRLQKIANEQKNCIKYNNEVIEPR